MAETVVLNIVANLRDNAGSGIGGLRKRLTGLREGGRGVDAALKALKVSALAIGAGVGVVAGLGTAALSAAAGVAEAGAELSKMSIQTGITVEGLSELQHVARRNRVDFDDFKGSIEEMNLRLGEALTGAEPFIERFTAIGLNVDDLRGKAPEKIFEEIIGALEKIPDAQERAFAADEIFGGDAFKLFPIIEQGAEGIRNLREEARELGLVMSSETAAAGVEFQEAVQDLQSAAGGLARQVGAALLPILTVLARRALPLISKGVSIVAPIFLAAAKAVAFMADNLLNLINFILDFAQPVIQPFLFVIQQVGDLFGLAGEQAGKVSAPISKLNTEIKNADTTLGNFYDSFEDFVEVGQDSTEVLRDMIGELNETTVEVQRAADYWDVSVRDSFARSIEFLGEIITGLETSTGVTVTDVNDTLEKIGILEASILASNLDKSTKDAFLALLADARATAEGVRQTLLSGFDLSGRFVPDVVQSPDSFLRGVPGGLGDFSAQQNINAVERSRQSMLNDLLGPVGGTGYRAPPAVDPQNPYRDFGPYVDVRNPAGNQPIYGPGNFNIYGNRSFGSQAPVNVVVQADTIIGADNNELAERITEIAEQGLSAGGGFPGY